MLVDFALHAVDEAIFQLRHAQADRRILAGVPGVAAEARVDPGESLKLLARASAGVGQAAAQQLLDHCGVVREAFALPLHRAVPFEAVALQGFQDRLLGARDFAGRVEVLHAHQPAAADGTCVQVGGDGRHQGTEVQVAAGRRGEAAYIGRGHGASGAAGNGGNETGRLGAPSVRLRSRVASRGFPRGSCSRCRGSRWGAPPGDGCRSRRRRSRTSRTLRLRSVAGSRRSS
ncbi:Uncharacterised protein [Pseudomonas aeruginosa]|nr:Uncharacterised protein [Pseudomonas aeruginosa]